MKKLVCLLAVIALAAPLYAAEGDPNVLIECFDEDNGVCRVEYTVLMEDGNSELMRGLALDIEVSGNATIESVSDYATGAPGTVVPTGYSVFVGQIDFGTDPNNVDDWGSPLTTTNTAYGALPDNGMTVELASLYEMGVDTPPAASGILLKFTVDFHGDADTTVTITANALRGEIVMEDVQHANIIADGCNLDGVVCFSGPLVTAGMFTDWQTFGEPECWCYANQCYGDATGTTEGSPVGGWWYVGTNDLNILSAAWKVKEPAKGPGIGTIPNGICADFAHDKEGSPVGGWWRVGTNDLNILSANWKIKEPPKGVGLDADCVDSPVAP